MSILRGFERFLPVLPPKKIFPVHHLTGKDPVKARCRPPKFSTAYPQKNACFPCVFHVFSTFSRICRKTKLFHWIFMISSQKLNGTLKHGTATDAIMTPQTKRNPSQSTGGIHP